MASIDSFLGSSLQNLNTLDKKIANDGSDENMKKVVEYLYTLTEQLRYMFNNLDENNFTEGTIQNIVRSETDESMSLMEQTAYAINTQVKGVEGDVSTLEQTASSLTTRVTSVEGRTTTVEQTATGLTATVSGLKSAQDATKLIFDSNGLTIKNGGFKIVNSSNTSTLSVDTAGNISILGTYKTASNASGVNARLSSGALDFYNGTTGVASMSFSSYLNWAFLYLGGTSSSDASLCLTGGASAGGSITLYGSTSGGVSSIIMCPSHSASRNIWLNSTNSSGSIWAHSYNNYSSRRYKQNIKNMSDSKARQFLDLNFVEFEYKQNPGKVQHGLIAEDIAKFGLDDIVVYDEQNRPDAIDYTKLIPYMGKLIQEQEKRIKALEMKQ